MSYMTNRPSESVLLRKSWKRVALKGGSPPLGMGWMIL